MDLTLQEAATQLGKSIRQLRYLIQTGRLRAVKVQGRWHIRSQDLPEDPKRAAASRRKRRQHRRLELNPRDPKKRRGEVASTTRPVTFLGYRASRTGIRPGKRMMKRMKQRFRELRGEPAVRIARSIESYRGWISFG